MKCLFLFVLVFFLSFTIYSGNPKRWSNFGPGRTIGDGKGTGTGNLLEERLQEVERDVIDRLRHGTSGNLLQTVAKEQVAKTINVTTASGKLVTLQVDNSGNIVGNGSLSGASNPPLRLPGPTSGTTKDNKFDSDIAAALEASMETYKKESKLTKRRSRLRSKSRKGGVFDRSDHSSNQPEFDDYPELGTAFGLSIRKEKAALKGKGLSEKDEARLEAALKVVDSQGHRVQLDKDIQERMADYRRSHQNP